MLERSAASMKMDTVFYVLVSVAVYMHEFYAAGAIQVLPNAVGGGRVSDFPKKRYEDIRCNVICVTRGWVGVICPEKKRYVTL